MNIQFLNHALLRMAERNISRLLVEQAVERLDKVERSVKDIRRLLFKKKYTHDSAGERLLIVVAEKSGNTVVVVTIIDTSRIQRYL
ncbi:MAG: DUF4258 domain-containing protein [Candidatus Sungbacteria bacterium]|nr:DUF4258 domain-containing protein [Candidatus Sungbacteria bacterium]